VAQGRDGKQAANWVINELFGRLNKEARHRRQPGPARAAGRDHRPDRPGDISGKIAKDLFEIVWTEGGDPAEIVEARGMKQVTDTGAIEAAVDEIIAANPAQVEKAKQNPKLAGWFVGQVMKATGGKANPKAVNEIVTMNELAQDGWEYQRAESLPDEEKKGLMGGKEIVTRNILVFRRELYFEEASEEAPAVEEVRATRTPPLSLSRRTEPAAPVRSDPQAEADAAADMDSIYSGARMDKEEPAPTERRPLVADRKGQGVDF
jgi:hypothetical protein